MQDKTKNNVLGSYYVDTECISCDACILVAEKHFKLNEDDFLAYVCKQPKTAAEKELCQEAMDTCPVEAIHNDG